jgi:Phage integrase family
MRAGLIVGDLRVQVVVRGDGRRSFSIVDAGGVTVGAAEGFLRTFEGSGTQRTYAFFLVDHLRWLAREGLAAESVRLEDLVRYMGAAGAKLPVPGEVPWRVAPRRPYGAGALQVAAACVKGFYLHRCALGVNMALRDGLDGRRLPSRADRDRRMLGHLTRSVPANPLAVPGLAARHPKVLPDQARSLLLAAVRTARDRLVVTWLADGGLRIGELCGLHLVDLHLRADAGCGQCAAPHVHVCHRPGNPNRAAAKTKPDWAVAGGVVTGGMVKRVSPAMVHSYFEYVTSEYPRAGTGHGMLLVQLAGPGAGQAWGADAARGMLRRAGARAGLGPRIRPHMFRHSFATAVLDAAGGNLLVARHAGGWASTRIVEDVYGHPDLHDPVFTAALARVWAGGGQ